MAKLNYDGVVEAVHYQQDGQVGWVRAYLRRGAIFSDVLVLDRQTVLTHLKSGKRYMAGRRILQLGGTFEVTQPLKVYTRDGRDFLVTGDLKPDRDELPDIPVI